MSGSDILDDLQARGLVHDSTDLGRLRERLDAGPITVYAGFDPTADSLHIGNLVPLLLLRRFQDAGHRPIALAGGATGMIGDPSGRSNERNLLDMDTLNANVAAIVAQLRRLLNFTDGPTGAQLVDNRTWTTPVSVLDFLRDIGKHFTVNAMLAKESVRSRIDSESGISFTEFSYMLLQANDFLRLYEAEHCELQVGGSDQWGNITAGIDLIRRRSGHHAHGLSVPLVLRSDGLKFGKTAEGTVWLSAERTSPYAFYQYWINTDDRDVERFLLQMTLLPVTDAAAVAAAHAAAPEQRSGQRRLAREVTALVHGDRAADEAAAASMGFTKLVTDMNQEDFGLLRGEIPTTSIKGDDLESRTLVDWLLETGLEKSKSAARRSIDAGSIYVNDVPVRADRILTRSDLHFDEYLLVRRGKKVRHLLHITA